MALTMKRLILFTKDMPRLTAFYRDVIGLRLRLDDADYKEFDAGGCAIALHNGTSRVGARPPKMVFFARDVAKTRTELMARGAKLGAVLGKDGLIRCEGKDPDGNPYSISNRA
jgi:predicted enzyme related to lactoylglutathione lyase